MGRYINTKKKMALQDKIGTAKYALFERMERNGHDMNYNVLQYSDSGHKKEILEVIWNYRNEFNKNMSQYRRTTNENLCLFDRQRFSISCALLTKNKKDNIFIVINIYDFNGDGNSVKTYEVFLNFKYIHADKYLEFMKKLCNWKSRVRFMMEKYGDYRDGDGKTKNLYHLVEFLN